MAGQSTVFLLVTCVPFLAAPLCAQDSRVPAEPGGQRNGHRPAYPADAVQRGHDEFLKTCAFCHGVGATGTSNGPNLILSTVVRHDERGDQIGPVVRQGRTSKGMPAFNFTDAEIADLSAFLHARMAASDLRSAEHPMGEYSLDKLLTGNPEAGKAFFFQKGKCSSCHSPTGDLAGIGRKYPPVMLQSRMLYPPDSRQTATVTDTSGHQWKGQLLLLTNFDVAIQDAGGWYRSWPLHSASVKIDDPLAAHRALLPTYTDADMHNVFAYLESLK